MWVDSSRLYPGQETQYYSELDNSGRYRSYKDSSGDQGRNYQLAGELLRFYLNIQVMLTPVTTTTCHCHTPTTTHLTTTITNIARTTTRGSSSGVTLSLITRLHCDLLQPSRQIKI